MKRSEYLESVFKSFNEGKIGEDALDLSLMNIENFCDEED